MKISITKSQTKKVGDNIQKTEYTLGDEGSDADALRNQLETKINQWLMEGPSTSAPKSLPQTEKKCACGRIIKNPKYERCYECWTKKQQ